LADSLPAPILEGWKLERQSILQRSHDQKRELTDYEIEELEKLYNERIESYLDAGHGECVLGDRATAEIVSNALKHFDGQRYDLIAWAVMPNHVHVILKPYEGIDLPGILHSWKSYTAKEINKELGRAGELWMTEYYDHLIREDQDLWNQVHYILANPVKAGLQDWPWVGCSTGVSPVNIHGQDARDTRTGETPVIQITHVTVATTRPETMLGDTAVAMNPSDPRAKYLVGKMVRLPIVGRLIPIIADEHVVLPNPDSDDEKAKFSTGFLKVTPAHDPDDWAIGQRHDLPVINVMAPDGSISDKHGWEDADSPEAQNLLGMDRFEAREAIVEWFRQEKLLEDVRDYTHEVGHSYRSHVPIEPYLSDQWYIAVKKPIDNGRLTIDDCRCEVEKRDGVTYIKGTDVPVNSLAGLALTPLLEGRVRFIPERYTKNYQGWLENLRDWPISRQLWWGHQIPVWSRSFESNDMEAFQILDQVLPDILEDILESRQGDESYLNIVDSETGEILQPTVLEFNHGLPRPITIYVVLKNDAIVKLLEQNGFVRDEDVLDTWFSSALWPFSTMGWPDENETLKKFYPTQVLCTAREIITLWVSRMVMMGQYCVGDIPYSDVYIHAMIQDGQGRKMSKSLGNGIDPLVAIDSHGADAMRFTLASMTTDTQDVRMPVSEIQLPDGRTVNSSPKFDLGRSFCNKLWNASRFAMLNLEGTDPAAFDVSKMDTTDKWILSRLAKTIAAVTDGLEAFKYKEPLDEIYKFFWNDFCDWYLEWTKPRMQERSTGVQAVNHSSTGVSPVNGDTDNATGGHRVSAHGQDAHDTGHGQDARATAQNVLAFVLDQVLRMLHPFVPFITEGIFQNLNDIAPRRGLKGIMDLTTADSIMIAPWPQRIDGCMDEQTERQIETVQNVIRAIRDVRSQYTIPPARPLACSASAPEAVCDMLNKNLILIQKQAFIESLTIETGLEKPDNAAAIVIGDIQIYVHDAVDKEAERNRLQKQKEFIEKGIAPLAGKLGNENFTSRAKPEVVEQSRQKLKELQDQLAAVEKLLAELG
jgi:valyl-tRNA synthetase